MQMQTKLAYLLYFVEKIKINCKNTGRNIIYQNLAVLGHMPFKRPKP